MAGSSNATLLVFADTNPPVLLGAQSASTNGVNVFFSEPLLPGTATNKANYTLNGPGGAVTINNATLDPIGATVTLATAPLLSGSNYTLRVSGLRDRSSRSNLIAPGSLAGFSTARKESRILKEAQNEPFPSPADVGLGSGSAAL